MSPAYVTASWQNFFVAEAGAAAALTGLLFVAVSINLSKVLEYPQLPGRAAESLLVLCGVLGAGLLGLVPGQSRQVLALELLGLGLVVWAFPIKSQLHAHQPDMPRSWIIARVISHQIASLPLIIGSISLFFGVGGGLYWLVPMAICSFGAALSSAWVLLIEIMR